MHDLPGKFDPVKAQALGIAKGPMYGKLQKGETVTLPNGTQVRPCVVCVVFFILWL